MFIEGRRLDETLFRQAGSAADIKSQMAFPLRTQLLINNDRGNLYFPYRKQVQSVDICSSLLFVLKGSIHHNFAVQNIQLIA